ncbi:AMP-binding protein [Kitasatospora sp. NPDC004272]
MTAAAETVTAGSTAETVTGTLETTAEAAPPSFTPSPERAAEYLRRGWWRRETFLDDLRRQARLRPRKLAVAARRIGESRTDTLDYAELARLTDRFAVALLELGVRRGDFIAVQLPNRWETVPLLFAAIRIGAVTCPIDPVCQEEELRHRLELTGARVIVTVPEWNGYPLAAHLTALKADLPLEHVAVVGGRSPGTLSFEDHFVHTPWEEGRTGDLEGLELTPDEPFVVLFTSGTTGLPKGVLHSQNTVHAAVRGYADTFLLDDGLVAAVTTPLVHYSGFGQGVLTGVMVGGTVAFQDLRRNDALLDLVERYGATLVYGPPSTLADIVRAQRAEPRDVSTLRYAITGSAPVLQDLVDDVRETLGARTYSVWGMSEFGPVTITRLDYDADRAAYSNGGPIDAMELRVDHPDDPTVRAAVGRLRVRGAAQSLGYHKRADAFAAELDADGWFDTGDLARTDGRGGVRILGRARDALLRDGAVVPMTELEAIVSRHPDVAETALVGTTGRHDDPILAVVVPSGPARPDLDGILAHLRAAGQEERFLPERLVLVDALPKTLTGKVRKAELRRRHGGQ